MNNRYNPWRLGAVLLAVAALAACGGGNDAAISMSTSSAPVLAIDAYVQPQGVADSGGIQTRSWDSDGGPAPTPAQFKLGALAQPKTSTYVPGGARQIGVARDLAQADSPDALAAQLRWTPRANGSQVAALSVTADGAYGLRLAVRILALPAQATVRVYNPDRPSVVYEVSGAQLLQTLARNQQAGASADAARTWWTPETGSFQQTLEIELPAGTDRQALRIAVPQISHIFDDLSLPPADGMVAKVGESDSCNLDATCYDDLASQRNAVARMLFTKDGNTYVCTGTLLNDAGNSGTPYFLSANHCISDQTTATNMQIDWFYRSPSCNSRTLSSSAAKGLGGATLLYASANTDTSFMRLNNAPPAGAVFAGWDATAQSANVTVFGLHHPVGDLLKASFGTKVGETSCTANGSQFSCNGTSGNFYRVGWSTGTTQGGSSGSSLFAQGTKRVIGTLYGGAASCTASGGIDLYGRFDVAYEAALKTWLAAGNPGNNGGGPSGGNGSSPLGDLMRTFTTPR